MDPLEQFRLELGDTDPARQLFTDEQAQHFLDQRAGVVLLAVADACDALARRFSREYDFAEDGQSFRRSQMATAYREQAKELRQRAGGGLTVVGMTRVDGYSEDVSARDGAGQESRSGRVRAGYYDPDLPA